MLLGPFQGMRYYNKIVWGPITPKWLGSYELELHDIVQTIIAERYAVIIDIGAAEGYYAVGLAQSCPGARVISYDIDWLARRRQRQLAALNHVTNLDIRKRCTHDELERVIDGRCLVIADIEGVEVALLDPARAPSLLNTDLLVECHRHESLSMEAVAGLLEQRFSSTHRIERISMEPREAGSLKKLIPALRGLNDDIVEYAAKEYRNYFQQWLWMRRYTAHPSGNA